MREAGYYWVRFKNDIEWICSEYNPADNSFRTWDEWTHEGDLEINETRIKNPDEK